jgi:hypothetical protein
MDSYTTRPRPEKAVPLSAEFIEKYHPQTSGSAAGLHQIAGRMYQQINDISRVLHSGDYDKKVISDSALLLERMKDDITPKLMAFSKEVTQLEKGQNFDRMLAYIAVLVAVIGIFFPLIFY